MTPSTKKMLPYLALAGAILCLGLSPFFIRWADAPGPVTAFYRTAIATLFLTPFILHRRAKNPVPFNKDMIKYPLIAGLLTSGDLILWTTALGFTKAASATLMGNLAPLWVALIAWLFLRESLRRIFWTGLVLILAGGAVVMGGDILLHPSFGFGDLLAMFGSFFYAGYMLVTQRARQFLDTVPFLWWMNLSCCLGIFVYTQLANMPLTGYSLQTYLIFLAAAFVTQTVGFFTVAYVLGHLPASLVSPTLIGQPLLVAILAIPLLGENLLPLQWAGVLAVIGGIILIHRSREVRVDTVVTSSA